MNRHALLAIVAAPMIVIAGEGRLAEYFKDLPEGTDPATISRRVTDQFLTTRPENYKPAGYYGNKGYGWNRIVQYSVVSLWMNAIECAKLTEDEYRMKRLVDRPDDKRNWGETSCTAMFAYAYLVGVRRGWLDGATYGPSARRAYLALCSRMDKWGDIADVWEGTSKRNDLEYYFKRKHVNGDPHAQAPMLWIVSTLMADGDDEVGDVPHIWNL